MFVVLRYWRFACSAGTIKQLHQKLPLSCMRFDFVEVVNLKVKEVRSLLMREKFGGGRLEVENPECSMSSRRPGEFPLGCCCEQRTWLND